MKPTFWVGVAIVLRAHSHQRLGELLGRRSRGQPGSDESGNQPLSVASPDYTLDKAAGTTTPLVMF